MLLAFYFHSLSLVQSVLLSSKTNNGLLRPLKNMDLGLARLGLESTLSFPLLAFLEHKPNPQQ